MVQSCNLIKKLTHGSTFASTAISFGAAVGVRQHTTHTRTPASFTNVQCSHCHGPRAADGGLPSHSSLLSWGWLTFELAGGSAGAGSAGVARPLFEALDVMSDEIRIPLMMR